MYLRAWGSDSGAKSGSEALFDNRVDSWVLGRECACRRGEGARWGRQYPTRPLPRGEGRLRR